MKILTKISVILSILLSLSSCFKGLDPEEKIIATELLIDNEKFIQESKERSGKISKHGPKTDEFEETNIRDKMHFMIDKEEPSDYILSTDDPEIVFPIDLNLENVDVRVFAQMMSKITGINVLVSDEVGGYVSAKLHDVPWPDALDTILSMKALAKHIDKKANIIRIHSQEVIVQLEEFERQRKQDLQKSIMLARAEEPLYTELFKLFYTKPDEVKTILENVLGVAASSDSSSGGRNVSAQITVDKRLNQLIIKARRADLDLVNKVIEKIDTRTKQVFIEAFILEVTDDFEKQLGVRLGGEFSETYKDMDNKSFNIRATGLIGTAATSVSAGTNESTLANFPVTGATSGIGILWGLGDLADLKVELSALESDGYTKVLSNPRIFTLDNQEAVIFQGSEIPYETVSADGTEIQFKEAGLKLTVTPSVVGDGNLMMAIALNKDTADTSLDNPPITKSEITTNLVTKDGSVVVIGGIYTQTRTDSNEKVPLFGDIPVAGRLFRKDKVDDDRKELMIFISPKII